MKKTVLFIILDQFADWEAAYLSAWISPLGQNNYEVKTLSLTKDPVRSIGGFTVLPDYDIGSVPTNYEALILIGGMSWRTEPAQKVRPLVQTAFQCGKVLGGICDAAAFLGTIGILNDMSHTANDLEDLKKWAGAAYTGEAKYIAKPAVREHTLITANGTAPMEFAKEVLTALEIAPESKILEWYNFHKLGGYEAPMPSM